MMRIVIPIALALMAGTALIPFVYGMKKAFSTNPFVYSGIANLLCAIALLMISTIYGGVEKQYLVRHWIPISLGALGLVVVNISHYFVITRFGASYSMLSSLFMMLMPALVVGYLIFKERCNLWIVPCIACALLTVLFFALSKR
jgi:hypothetical protein